MACQHGQDYPANCSKCFLRKRAKALYRPPFRFDHGYVFDADGNMVADQGGSEPEDAPLRVRGWGRIGRMEDAEQLQDEVGRMIAEILTAAWEPDVDALRLLLPCEYLHHDRDDWHDHDKPCPIKARLLGSDS